MKNKGRLLLVSILISTLSFFDIRAAEQNLPLEEPTLQKENASESTAPVVNPSQPETQKQLIIRTKEASSIDALVKTLIVSPNDTTLSQLTSDAYQSSWISYMDNLFTDAQRRPEDLSTIAIDVLKTLKQLSEDDPQISKQFQDASFTQIQEYVRMVIEDMLNNADKNSTSTKLISDKITQDQGNKGNVNPLRARRIIRNPGKNNGPGDRLEGRRVGGKGIQTKTGVDSTQEVSGKQTFTPSLGDVPIENAEGTSPESPSIFQNTEVQNGEEPVRYPIQWEDVSDGQTTTTPNSPQIPAELTSPDTAVDLNESIKIRSVDQDVSAPSLKIKMTDISAEDLEVVTIDIPDGQTTTPNSPQIPAELTSTDTAADLQKPIKIQVGDQDISATSVEIPVVPRTGGFSIVAVTPEEPSYNLTDVAEVIAQVKEDTNLAIQITAADTEIQEVITKLVVPDRPDISSNIQLVQLLRTSGEQASISAADYAALLNLSNNPTHASSSSSSGGSVVTTSTSLALYNLVDTYGTNTYVTISGITPTGFDQGTYQVDAYNIVSATEIDTSMMSPSCAGGLNTNTATTRITFTDGDGNQTVYLDTQVKNTVTGNTITIESSR